jgi:hypothetical protein
MISKISRIAAQVLGVSVVSISAVMASPVGTISTIGVSTAVTTINVSSYFEDVASLNANYSEGGLSFSRVGLSTNNNGCGYAGCLGSFTSASGNYFYGVGQGGYIGINANGGRVLSGLELTMMTGWSSGMGPNTMNVSWRTYDSDGVQNGGGVYANITRGSVLGFKNVEGFSMLWLATTQPQVVNENMLETANAPAIDNVVGQYIQEQVPEPTSSTLLGLGALGLLASRKKKKHSDTPNQPDTMPTTA